MTKPRNPVWAELLQLVPIISLAFPFIVQGKVDLARAGSGFLIGALLTIPITALVVARKHLLNPILVGTNVWLWLGALAFAVPVPALADWLRQTQAFALFASALVAGVVTTFLSEHGYVACYSTDSGWIRRTSLGLLALTAVVVTWSWIFRHDIRLGGGLPFIVLNVVRRVLTVRAPFASAVSAS